MIAEEGEKHHDHNPYIWQQIWQAKAAPSGQKFFSAVHVSLTNTFIEISHLVKLMLYCLKSNKIL